MPSFADSIFLFVLALLLFGPKKLPVLARELGKWVGEFRRASNEFKMQMEDELRASEQADRKKQIAAMEAAAPLPPPLEEPQHPHLARTTTTPASDEQAIANSIAPPTMIRTEAVQEPIQEPMQEPMQVSLSIPSISASETASETLDGVRPIPIATAGDLHMMPPPTGLPTPRPRSTKPIGDLLDSIPEQASPPEAFARTANHTAQEHAIQENGAHGD